MFGVIQTNDVLKGWFGPTAYNPVQPSGGEPSAARLPCPPRSPTDCSTDTTLPAATPPLLAMAAADIILAATDPAAMPVPVNPSAQMPAGMPTSATPAGRPLGC